MTGARPQADTVGLVPRAGAWAAFAAGALLVVGGSLPEAGSAAPSAGTVDLSRLAGSVVGTALLLVARGLERRSDAAWTIALALCAAGGLAALGRGHGAVAAVLGGAGLLLVASRRHFDRRALLLAAPFSARWTVSILVVLAAAAALALVAHRDPDAPSEAWWQVAFSESASRSLRSLAAAAAMLVAFGVARLLRAMPPRAAASDPGERAEVRAIVDEAPRANARLALLGDKRFVWSADRSAFVMYGVQGSSLVAMGDPVGGEDAGRDAAARFVDLARRHDRFPVLHEVGGEGLPLYAELGLAAEKLGEEGRVALADFDLAGRERSKLRQAQRRGERDGCRFEVAPPEAVPAVLRELREISDRWLRDKRTREKRFSLGRFDPDYLALFPMALVRREEKVVAFANLWLGGGRNEVSPDLMRHGDAAPPGIMDYLFVEAILWAKAQGFRWFSLGMAPLSGLDGADASPAWSRLGSLIYRHGEHFYNFQGLRHFKEKFQPEWSPRYLVSPGGLALPRVLADVCALLAGGTAGVFGR